MEERLTYLPSLDSYGAPRPKIKPIHFFFQLVVLCRMLSTGEVVAMLKRNQNKVVKFLMFVYKYYWL
jgi:hypothetical protein